MGLKKPHRRDREMGSTTTWLILMDCVNVKEEGLTVVEMIVLPKGERERPLPELAPTFFLNP